MEEREINIISIDEAIEQGTSSSTIQDIIQWGYDEADFEYAKHKNDKTKDIRRAKRLKAQSRMLKDLAQQLRERGL